MLKFFEKLLWFILQCIFYLFVWFCATFTVDRFFEWKEFYDVKNKVTSSWDGHYQEDAFYDFVNFSMKNSKITGHFFTEYPNLSLDKRDDAQKFINFLEQEYYGTPEDLKDE